MANRTVILASTALPVAAGVAAMLMPLLILGAAGGAVTSLDGAVLCAAGGTGQTIANVRLDAEQMGNAHTIVTVTATRHLPVYAAAVAVDAAFTESSLRNNTVQSDHDSEGLFQQRVSIYTRAVADDPVKATGAFLTRLVGAPNWQTTTIGDDAQTVQRSQHPERYQPNAALAQQIVSQFWAAAAAAAGPVPTASRPTSTSRRNPSALAAAVQEDSSAPPATTSPAPRPPRPDSSSPARPRANARCDSPCSNSGNRMSSAPQDQTPGTAPDSPWAHGPPPESHCPTWQPPKPPAARPPI